MLLPSGSWIKRHNPDVAAIDGSRKVQLVLYPVDDNTPIVYNMCIHRKKQKMSTPSRPTPKRQPLVRIDAADKLILDQLVAETGESLPKLLHRAIVQLRKHVFFDDVNAAYSDIRSNEALWVAEERERALYDVTLSDGLDSPTSSKGKSKRKR